MVNWLYKRANRKRFDGGKTEYKEGSKVQIFAGGLHCGVSENHNLDSFLRENLVTLVTGKNTCQKQSKKHGKCPV